MSEPFIGEVKVWAGNFAPRGWAFCNGQLLPIAQNTALFSLLGTTYGGDGRTTMGLPNLQGRFPMHPGNGPGLTSRRLGETGGAETVALTEAQIPSHAHATTVAPARTSDRPGPAALPAPGGHYGAADGIGPSTLSAGSGAPHDNMPPYLSLSFIIALTGLYPSRS